MTWPWTRNRILLGALAEAERARIAMEEELRSLRSTIEVERAKRIAAESVSSERLAEILRLRTDLQSAGEREQNRMKSLDLLNVKLMESKAEPPPPDIKQFALQQVERLKDTIRSQNKAVDLALLTKFYSPKRTLGTVEGGEDESATG